MKCTCTQAYAGRVREDIDHRALQPAAWRVDDYLDLDDSKVAPVWFGWTSCHRTHLITCDAHHKHD